MREVWKAVYAENGRVSCGAAYGDSPLFKMPVLWAEKYVHSQILITRRNGRGKMIHFMKLKPIPFAMIKSGKKDVEMRLNDEKRRAVQVGDTVCFTNVETAETIHCVVLARHEYPTFAGLYAAFDKMRLGYLSDEIACPDDMQKYYPKEEIAQYGVVGLEVKLL